MDKVQYLENLEGSIAGMPSKNVWADCPVLDIELDPAVGWHHFENWTKGTHSYTSTTAANGYNCYFDTGGSIATTATTSLTDGILRPLAIAVDATGTDEEAAIQWLDQTSDCISIDAGGPKVWFEACIKASSITVQSLFVGFAEAGAPGDSLLDDDGTGLSVDNIGFHALQGAPAALLAGHGAANPTSLGTAQTLVATTYYNLGMKFDGELMRYYLNGVEKYSVSTGATDFPNGEEMVPLFTLKAHEAAAKTLSVGWWRGAALYA